jgi:hypothetical protein
MLRNTMTTFRSAEHHRLPVGQHAGTRICYSPAFTSWTRRSPHLVAVFYQSSWSYTTLSPEHEYKHEHEHEHEQNPCDCGEHAISKVRASGGVLFNSNQLNSFTNNGCSLFVLFASNTC